MKNQETDILTSQQTELTKFNCNHKLSTYLKIYKMDSLLVWKILAYI